MKRMLLFLCVFFGGTLTLMSQITGGFYQQNGYVYFMGQNISGGALRNLTIRCVNSVLSQQQTFLIFHAKFQMFSTKIPAFCRISKKFCACACTIFQAVVNQEEKIFACKGDQNPDQKKGMWHHDFRCKKRIYRIYDER